MPCATAKSMRFRLFECRYDGYPSFSDVPAKEFHNPKYHFDTGKEFDIIVPDDTLPASLEYAKYYGVSKQDYGITRYTIALVMMKKIYGFGGDRFTAGWQVNEWTNGKEFMNGTLFGIWYIKRVI
jgi:hypothetical protein